MYGCLQYRRIRAACQRSGDLGEKAGEPGENLDPRGTGEAAAPGPAGAAAAPAAGGFPPEALASLQRSEAYLLSIKKWVKFFGILTILALIGGLITLLALSDVF